MNQRINCSSESINQGVCICAMPDHPNSSLVCLPSSVCQAPGHRNAADARFLTPLFIILCPFFFQTVSTLKVFKSDLKIQIKNYLSWSGEPFHLLLDSSSSSSALYSCLPKCQTSATPALLSCWLSSNEMFRVQRIDLPSTRGNLFCFINWNIVIISEGTSPFSSYN